MSADQILPGLWMGSHPRYPSDLSRIDVWVMCARELQDHRGAPPHVRVIKLPMSDDGVTLTKGQAERAGAATLRIEEELAAGKQVLVTCAEGRNRSGLVTALVVRRVRGWKGSQAVRWVRARRKARALTSPVFVRYLRSLG